MEQNQTIYDFLTSYFNAHQTEMVDMLQTFVNTRSNTGNPAQTNQMASILCQELEALGCKCTIYSAGEQAGQVVEATLGDDTAQQPVLFSGHYDTVALPGEHPFYQDAAGNFHGLGVLDMKGGIVIAIWAVKALLAYGWKDRPIRFLFVGDEESGHCHGNAKELILKYAKGALCAFNMETGLLSNAICVGRKGTGLFHITVHGVAAHSGNNWTQGRSAITEMMYKIAEINELTNLAEDTTVTVTTIQGGTVLNSVPPICSCTVDLRYRKQEERERVIDTIKVICENNTVDGTSCEWDYADMISAFETNEETIALASFVDEVSQAYGFGAVDQVKLGGGSDASYITQAGVPCVCSMGAQGEHNHSQAEYATAESFLRRGKLLALCVYHSAAFAAKMNR